MLTFYSKFTHTLWYQNVMGKNNICRAMQTQCKSNATLMPTLKHMTKGTLSTQTHLLTEYRLAKGEFSYLMCGAENAQRGTSIRLNASVNQWAVSHDLSRPLTLSDALFVDSHRWTNIWMGRARPPLGCYIVTGWSFSSSQLLLMLLLLRCFSPKTLTKGVH